MKESNLLDSFILLRLRSWKSNRFGIKYFYVFKERGKKQMKKFDILKKVIAIIAIAAMVIGSCGSLLFWLLTK